MTITKGAGKLAVDGAKPLRGSDNPLPRNVPRDIGPRARQLIDKVLESGFTYNMVADFEKALAAACGVRYACAVSNCTAANHSVIAALNIGPGDDVVVTPISDYGSVAGILYQGATPVFPDVDLHTGLITAAEVEKVITPRTRAIIAVHFYGHMCDMDPLVRLARKHNVKLVEDVAQATMASYKGKRAGSVGDIGTFSFNASKLLTTYNGGMVISDDEGVISAVKRFAIDRGAIYTDSGARRYHPEPGYNYRMGQLEAAVGVAQLDTLEDQNLKRVKLAQRLTEKLAQIDGVIPPRTEVPGSHLYWLYHVQFEPEKFRVGPDQIERALNAEGLSGGFAMYYLIPHSHYFIKNREAELERLVNARAHLERTYRMGWTYKYADRDVDDIAEIFARVADAYRA